MKFSLTLLSAAFLFLPRIALGDVVTCWGDSMTGGNTTDWPAQFAALSGATVNVRGIGGQTSTQIKDRFMAEPARWGDFTIIWAGRNNYQNAAQVQADVATMVTSLTNPNYFVIGVTNGSYPTEWSGQPNYATLTGLNTALAATYGSKFIDIRRVLVDAYNPADPADVIDYSHDVVPSSLRGDNLHLNPAGQTVVANKILAAYQLVVVPPVDSTKTTWNNGSTDWGNPANWTNGLPSGTAVARTGISPTSNAALLTGINYTVNYSAASTFNDLTITNVGINIATLNVNAAMTLTGINEASPLGQLNATRATINVGSTGSILAGALIQMNSSSTLNVATGGVVRWGESAFNQGLTLNNGTTVNVSGTLSATTSGFQGNQAIIVNNGDGGAVNLNVSGGTLVTDGIEIGKRGTGNVTVTGGGSVTVRNNLNQGITMGETNNVNNVANLTVTNGTFSNAKLLKVGIGTSNAARTTITSTSTITVNGGTFNQTGATFLGQGRVGILNISSGSFTAAANDITVGGQDKSGNLAPTGSAAASGSVNISGGSLSTTALRIGDSIVNAGSNAGFAVPGTLNLSGGTITTDLLSATNGTNSTIAFSGGTLNTKATSIANGSTFTVGNGISPAELDLLGGNHTFANGLTVSTQAVLSGVGAITGNTSVFGTYGAHLTSSGAPAANLISVTGALALQSSAILQIADDAAVPVLLAPGSTFTILSCTGARTGTFTGLSEGSSITVGPNTFTIHYTSTSVTLQTVASYTTWASANGIPGEPSTGDFDHDGLDNGLEYALGLDPAQASAAPGTLAGNVLTFTKGAAALANGDVTYLIEESDDLGVTDTWETVVIQTPPDASPTISHTIPGGKTKNFARLKVVVTP